MPILKTWQKKMPKFKNLPYSLAARNQQMESADFIQIDEIRQEWNPLFNKDKFSFGHYKVLKDDDAAVVKDYLSRFVLMNDSLYVERLFLPVVQNHACQVPVTHWYTVLFFSSLCPNSLVSMPFIFLWLYAEFAPTEVYCLRNHCSYCCCIHLF